MKKLGIVILTGMALAVLFNATLTEAGTPVTAKLNYQGRLTDSNGVPITDGNYNIIFQIFDADVAGASVWGPETHTGVAVEDGLFSVNLGGGTPTPVTLSGIDFNKDCWLQTTVGATTYTPRQLLTAVTYSLFALSAPSGSIDHGALTGLGDDDHTQYFALAQNETVTGIPAFNGGTSGVSAPFSVDSDSKVTLLNADQLDSLNTGNASGNIPVSNSTLNTNLNADMVDGYHAASFILDGCTDCLNATEIEDIYVFNNSDTMSGSLGIGTTLSVGTNATVGGTLWATGTITGASTVQGTQLISTIVTGTKPLNVTSTTMVDNLNADYLDGQHGSYYMTGTTDNWVNITGDTMTGELITPAIRLPAAGYSSGVPVDIGDVAVDYPANLGWAATYNATMLLSGLNSTSIGFHDSGHSVGTLRYTNNNFYMGETGTWGVSNLTVGGTVTGTRLISNIAAGTAPLVVTSGTVVTNLNADLLDGLHSTAFMGAGADLWVNTTGDTMSGNLDMGGSSVVTNAARFDTTGVSSYDKFRVWNSGSYAIGMTSGNTYGGIINEYAMTFTMDTTANRGFLWRDSADAVTDAAMSLSTGGILKVKGAITADDFICATAGCVGSSEIADIYVFNTSDTMSGTLGVTGAITGSSTVQGTQLISTVAVGTAPLTVTSTTNVTNLNADLLDGYHLSTTRNAINTVPVRDANGYLQVGWINTPSGDNGTTAITKIYASSDDYIRYYTPANFETVMRPYIDDYFVLKAGDTMTGRLGQSSSGFHAGTKDDITTRTDSGFFQTSSATTAEGWPITSNSWYHLLTSTHTNDANYYSMQFSADFFDSNNLFYRSSNCGITTGCTTAWNRIWHSGNDGSGSGLDADLLDGYHLSTTRNAINTVPVRDASGYLQLGWINTTSGDATTTAPTKVYASNDDYIRYYTPAQFMTHMAAGGNVCKWGTNVKVIDGTYGDTDTCPAGYCAITMVNTGNTNVYPEGGAGGRGSFPQHIGDAKLLCCRCQL